MKPAPYEPLLTLNRAFDDIAQALKILIEIEALPPDFSELQGYAAEELRALINTRLASGLHTRGMADAARFGKLKIEAEQALDQPSV